MELEVGVKSWEPYGSGTEVVVGEGETANWKKIPMEKKIVIFIQLVFKTLT